jgi:hypothetical protein
MCTFQLANVTGINQDSIEVEGIRYEIYENVVYLMKLLLDWLGITSWSHYLSHQSLLNPVGTQPS